MSVYHRSLSLEPFQLDLLAKDSISILLGRNIDKFSLFPKLPEHSFLQRDSI